ASCSSSVLDTGASLRGGPRIFIAVSGGCPIADPLADVRWRTVQRDTPPNSGPHGKLLRTRAGFDDDDTMSFDVFLQDFSDTPADRSESVGRVLRPLFDADGWNVVTADGSAAVFGASDVPLDGLMFNHIAGELAWDVIFDAAVAGDWVIMPVGGPVCIVTEQQADSIPEELQDVGLVLVRSGKDLRHAATADA
ncbi:hypothetical protein LQ757_06035, partial [Agromyces sp. SYSU K20354]|uniref:hypothetical protein n=1 Tax=Agromyces cavernae TaxID=2898659 RepID=UPI001E435A9A